MSHTSQRENAATEPRVRWRARETHTHNGAAGQTHIHVYYPIKQPQIRADLILQVLYNSDKPHVSQPAAAKMQSLVEFIDRRVPSPGTPHFKDLKSARSQLAALKLSWLSLKPSLVFQAYTVWSPRQPLRRRSPPELVAMSCARAICVPVRGGPRARARAASHAEALDR
eukprot:6185592-Pleurochrysis_carterae.AAC.2